MPLPSPLSSPPPPRIRVLLVDAFRDECEMYAEYLGVSGFDVSVSHTPESALESARTAAPVAIVTRIRQPKDHIDGIALTAAIKGDPSTRSIAVIVITTSILPEHHEAAVAAGCDAYMLLPRTPDELAGQIRAVLRARSAKRLEPRPVPRAPAIADPKKAR